MTPTINGLKEQLENNLATLIDALTGTQLTTRLYQALADQDYLIDGNHRTLTRHLPTTIGDKIQPFSGTNWLDAKNAKKEALEKLTQKPWTSEIPYTNEDDEAEIEQDRQNTQRDGLDVAKAFGDLKERDDFADDFE